MLASFLFGISIAKNQAAHLYFKAIRSQLAPRADCYQVHRPQECVRLSVLTLVFNFVPHHALMGCKIRPLPPTNSFPIEIMLR